MQHLEIDIDVAHALGVGWPAVVRARIVLPDPMSLSEAPVVCFARPSSSYSGAYYTQAMPGPGDGAQGEWHAARGWIFGALDTIGCTGAAYADPDALTFPVLARAAHAAEREILTRLANGLLVDGYPPVSGASVIGLGHSLGAALAIYQQAHHASYDGLVVLGFSAVHSHPPTPPGGSPVVVAWYPRDAASDDAEPLNSKMLDALAANPDTSDAAWRSLAWSFHHDDVPDPIVEEDLQHYANVASEEDRYEPRRPWHARRTPRRAARATLSPGVVALEAACITVPVLSAMGVRDLVPDPRGEARAFGAARSIDLFVCPRMGHVHNFASTRRLLWQRLHAFGEWCAAMRLAR